MTALLQWNESGTCPNHRKALHRRGSHLTSLGTDCDAVNSQEHLTSQRADCKEGSQVFVSHQWHHLAPQGSDCECSQMGEHHKQEGCQVFVPHQWHHLTFLKYPEDLHHPKTPAPGVSPEAQMAQFLAFCKPSQQGSLNFSNSLKHELLPYRLDPMNKKYNECFAH